MEKPKLVPSAVKNAALAVLATTLLQDMGPKAGKELTEDHPQYTSVSASPAVQDSSLSTSQKVGENQILYAVARADAPVETDPKPLVAESKAKDTADPVDSVRAGIAQTFDTAAALPTEAKAAKTETDSLTMSVEDFRNAFSTMISDTLAKKSKKTTLDRGSLQIRVVGEHLEFSAHLVATTWIKKFNITVTGTIRNKEDLLDISDSKVQADFGAEGKAQKQINPLLKHLCTDLEGDISGREHKKIRSMTLRQGAVVVVFEPSSAEK